jgi:hypothetical protein
MATAVSGGAESGNMASLEIAPRLKVDRDSRRYQWARSTDLMQARSGHGRPPVRCAILGAGPSR